ncbi:hypothetical protein QTO30_08090 [Yoonia sp. GPGPB17]|uniref:hypothetical protein n=1 Tax=Yoonia sp. GPGPB17 TaxID=3026147 RepID=UPI0030BE9E4B
MKLHFQHLRRTDNIGDQACSPYDYFDWGDATVSDLRDNDTPAYDIGVYGGGKIFRGLATYAGVRQPKSALNIAWGVSTVQSFPISMRYMQARRRMSIVGSRDYGDTRFRYAPCASCMSQIFDAPPAPEHNVVFYAHAGKTSKMGITIPNDIPVTDNHAASLQQALAFIASGKIVISNSYHGVYWGLLMGRKVLCLPFSNKFGGYRLPPHYATAKNWQNEIRNAVAQPDMLGLVRAATLDFKAMVDDHIAARS